MQAKLLDQSGLGSSNPLSTLMEPHLKLSKISTAPMIDATAYQYIIGSLRYMVHAQSNIAFIVCYLILFKEQPHEHHLDTR